MLTTTEELLTRFPVRKSREEKQAFRDAVAVYGQSLGYCVQSEGTNLILGDPDGAANLVMASCAGSDSGLALLLEIAATLQKRERENVCFVLLDSWSAYGHRKGHKAATDHQLVLYLDDVCQGDQISLIPSKKLKENRRKLTSLYKACGYFGRKSILVDENAKLSFFSNAKPFPYSLCICTLQKGKDTSQRNVDETNVNLLRAALTTFLTQRLV